MIKMTQTLDVKVAKMERDIEYIKEEVQVTKELIRDFIEKADEKYASKLTEKIVFAMAGVIMLLVLGALLKQVVI